MLPSTSTTQAQHLPATQILALAQKRRATLRKRTAPTLAHDHVVLTRSLAAAIIKASSRQRERALAMRATSHRLACGHRPPASRIRPKPRRRSSHS